MNNEWIRVSPSNKCPVCDKPDWCSIAASGDAVICARTDSPKRTGDAGWLHKLDDEPSGGPKRVRSTNSMSKDIKEYGDHEAWKALHDDFVKAIDASKLAALSAQLGLKQASLKALGVGYFPEKEIWTFPMYSAQDSICGFKTRLPDNSKRSVYGSRSGIFIPNCLPATIDRLFIVEGPTDCAAMVEVGHSAIGRPSNRGSLALTEQFIRERKIESVSIIRDNDDAGLGGAKQLAEHLCLFCEVNIALPPKGSKDAREALKNGAVKSDFDEVARNPEFEFSTTVN